MIGTRTGIATQAKTETGIERPGTETGITETETVTETVIVTETGAAGKETGTTETATATDTGSGTGETEIGREIEATESEKGMRALLLGTMLAQVVRRKKGRARESREIMSAFLSLVPSAHLLILCE